MAIKPILFNTEMVKAILEGRKTQTRRIVKPQPTLWNVGAWYLKTARFVCRIFSTGMKGHWPYYYDGDAPEKFSPYSVGDIVWVRETWNGDWCDPDICKYIYKADGGSALEAGYSKEPRWHPSIHMPKEAARIFLLVKNVRVERLQDISLDDCKAEGIWDDYEASSEKHHENLQRAAYPVVFKELWNSTISKADLPRYGWEANPWVWVIEFERTQKPEGWC